MSLQFTSSLSHAILYIFDASRPICRYPYYRIDQNASAMILLPHSQTAGPTCHPLPPSFLDSPPFLCSSSCEARAGAAVPRHAPAPPRRRRLSRTPARCTRFARRCAALRWRRGSVGPGEEVRRQPRGGVAAGEPPLAERHAGPGPPPSFHSQAKLADKTVDPWASSR